MGLSLVHGIMHQLNGHVAVESFAGGGSLFKLLLPVMDDSQKPAESPLRASDRSAAVPAKVLVVDDEVSVGSFIGELLEFHGYRRTVVSSSMSTLRAFTDDPDSSDLVLTDQTMPGDEWRRVGAKDQSAQARLSFDFVYRV